MPTGARWVLFIVESAKPAVSVELNALRTERREFIRGATKPEVRVVAVPIHGLDETVGDVALGSPDVGNNLDAVQCGNDPIDTTYTPCLSLRVLFGEAVRLAAAALGLVAPESFDIRHVRSPRAHHAPCVCPASLASAMAARGMPTRCLCDVFTLVGASPFAALREVDDG